MLLWEPIQPRTENVNAEEWMYELTRLRDTDQSGTLTGEKMQKVFDLAGSPRTKSQVSREVTAFKDQHEGALSPADIASLDALALSVEAK